MTRVLKIQNPTDSSNSKHREHIYQVTNIKGTAYGLDSLNLYRLQGWSQTYFLITTIPLLFILYIP